MCERSSDVAMVSLEEPTWDGVGVGSVGEPVPMG